MGVVVVVVTCCHLFIGCNLKKDVETCEVMYGGLLLLNNIVPHQRYNFYFRYLL